MNNLAKAGESELDDSLHALTASDFVGMFERIADGFFAVNELWSITYINKGACDFFGASLDVLVGKPIWDVCTPEMISCYRELFQRALRDQNQVTVEGFNAHQTKRVRLCVHPSPDGLSVILQDVTDVHEQSNANQQEYERLKHDADRLALSQRIARVGSWELDLRAGAVYWTEEVFRIFDLRPTPEPVPTETIYSMVLLEDRYKIQEAVENVRQGTPINVEYRIVRPNGDVRYVHSQQSEYTPPDAFRVFGMIQDITDRKRIEHQLKESQERYQSLKRYNPAGIVSLDLEGHFIGSNPAFELLLGYSLDDLKGLHVEDITSSEDFYCICEQLKSALNGQVMAEIEFRLKHKEGHFISVAMTLVPMIIRDKMSGLYAIVQDITERQQTQRKLRESEQRYKSLIEYNADGVCAIDLQGAIVSSNPAYQGLIGYSAEELSCMTFGELLLETDQLDISSLTSLQDSIHWDMRRRDGERIETKARTVPIVVDGEVVGVYLIIRDVTRQKQMEELLRKSEKLSAVGQLAAGVAHEIRNPLTALKGFLKIMGTSETVKPEYLTIMEDELSRIELISSELLVLGKPTVNVFRARNVRDMLESVVFLLETQSIMKNIEIHLDCASELPEVDCDENQLKQVFINIIKNAIEAMTSGGLLRVRVHTDAARQLSLSFTDTGKGIPADLLTKLGEPFYTTKEKGTGLGLMVTHKIVENHGGTIEYKSEVGVGTTVTVTLPISGT